MRRFDLVGQKGGRCSRDPRPQMMIQSMINPVFSGWNSIVFIGVGDSGNVFVVFLWVGNYGGQPSGRHELWMAKIKYRIRTGTHKGSGPGDLSVSVFTAAPKKI